MTTQDSNAAKVTKYWKSVIFHSFFGILEYVLILTAIIVNISNILLLSICVGLLSVIFFTLGYTIIFRNPFYYIASYGLAILTIFPSAISLILVISFSNKLTVPIRDLVVFALVIEAFYIFYIIRKISYTKNIAYFHRKYGYTSAATMVYRLYYSIHEFNRINKGRQYWQDQTPEEIEKKREEIEKMRVEIKKFKGKFKKKLLLWSQFFAVLGFITVFSISLVF